MRSGMSILELMLVMAMAAMLLVGVGAVLSGALRGARKTGVSTGVRNEGAFALSLIEQKIKFARKILACSTSGSDTITVLDTDEKMLELTYNPTNENLAYGSTVVTSAAVSVLRNPECLGVFVCDSAETVVTICYDMVNVNSQGLTSQKARVNYKSQVTLRNASLQ